MRIIHISFYLILLCSNFFGQKNLQLIDQGLKLYKNANYDGAITVFQKVAKESNNARAWYLLGSAYLKKNDIKNAQKAFDKTIKIEPSNAQAYTGLAYIYLIRNKDEKALESTQKALALDKQIAEVHYLLGVLSYRDGSFKAAYESAEKAINLNPKLAGAYLLKSESLAQSFGILLGAVSKSSTERSELLKDAVANLETYLKLTSQDVEAKEQRDRLEALKYLTEYYVDKEKQTAEIDDNKKTTPLKILSMSQPQYTERARQAGTQGVIRLSVVFSKDGNARYAIVLNKLNYGLTEEAIKAARKIKFLPATKDGQPISVVKTVEFRFAIY